MISSYYPKMSSLHNKRGAVPALLRCIKMHLHPRKLRFLRMALQAGTAPKLLK